MTDPIIPAPAFGVWLTQRIADAQSSLAYWTQIVDQNETRGYEDSTAEACRHVTTGELSALREVEAMWAKPTPPRATFVPAAKEDP